MRPLSFEKPGVTLQFSATQASYSMSPKGYLSISSFGYYTFDFVPNRWSGERTINDFSSKRSFLLEPKKSSEILQTNTVDEASTFDLLFRYSSNQKLLSIVRDSKMTGVALKLKEPANEVGIEISLSDFYIIQRCLDFAQPFVMGWEALTDVTHFEEPAETNTEN